MRVHMWELVFPCLTSNTSADLSQSKYSRIYILFYDKKFNLNARFGSDTRRHVSHNNIHLHNAGMVLVFSSISSYSWLLCQRDWRRRKRCDSVNPTWQHCHSNHSAVFLYIFSVAELRCISECGRVESCLSFVFRWILHDLTRFERFYVCFLQILSACLPSWSIERSGFYILVSWNYQVFLRIFSLIYSSRINAAFEWINK